MMETRNTETSWVSTISNSQEHSFYRMFGGQSNAMPRLLKQVSNLLGNECAMVVNVMSYCKYEGSGTGLVRLLPLIKLLFEVKEFVFPDHSGRERSWVHNMQCFHFFNRFDV